MFYFCCKISSIVRCIGGCEKAPLEDPQLIVPEGGGNPNVTLRSTFSQSEKLNNRSTRYRLRRSAASSKTELRYENGLLCKYIYSKSDVK